MNLSEHHYRVDVVWTGNRGEGTTSYRSYSRDHEVSSAGVPTIEGSADPTFHGNAARWNPEQLLLAALSQCHMLSYLHMAAKHDVVVVGYQDAAEGVMRLNPDGSGEFVSVTLKPRVTIQGATGKHTAQSIHHDAAAACFIGRSVNFPVRHEPVVLVETVESRQR
ncbi:organic hydroperoxide reductase OsmC/OhrA [Arthrobacter pigmenti]|uniref:Organic hydroperoxide reductase OsmC/OhrA n=1 Tax=Arthrobacter pigmenti TaxID=271432 RepID=A0A846RH73_9MICC|nr:OsmC family protein [Arthrobacter pigmenti]NJC22503.1 organic hydroperoxide reductase OsmC/OhrA [Arthrobacter pigmenti]